jgi:hypothetical protein
MTPRELKMDHFTKNYTIKLLLATNEAVASLFFHLHETI